MRNLIGKLFLVAGILSVFFIFTSNTAFAAPGIVGEITAQTARVDGKLQVTLTGEVNAEAKTLWDDDDLVVRFGKITSLENAASLTGQSLACQTLGANKFSCITPNLDYGSYRYQLIIKGFANTTVATLTDANRKFDVRAVTGGASGTSIVNLSHKLDITAISPTFTITGTLNAEAQDDIKDGYLQISSVHGVVKNKDPFLLSENLVSTCTINLQKTVDDILSDQKSTCAIGTGYAIKVFIDYGGELASTPDHFYYIKNTQVGRTYTNLIEFTAPVLSDPTYTLQPVEVNGTSATVTVNALNVRLATNYLLEVGNVVALGTSNVHSCVSNNPQTLSPSIATKTSNAVTPSVIKNTFNLQNPGLYCVRLRESTQSSQYPGDIVVEYFQEPNGGIFSVGGVKIPSNVTLNQKANQYGCDTPEDNSTYCLLAPLPGIGDDKGRLDTKDLGGYVNGIIRLIIGLTAVLSVLMLVIGGIQYMASTAVGGKQAARDRMQNAVLGILLAVGSYAILNTINPNLVNLQFYNASVSISDLDPGDEGHEHSDISIDATKLTDLSNVTVPTGSAQDLAQKILAHPKIHPRSSNIVLDTKDDARSAPLQNIVDTADGKPGWTSSRSHVGAKQVSVNAGVLKALILMADSASIQVNSILGGKHSSTSAHYQGRGLDIQAAQSAHTTNTALMNACRAAGAKPQQIFGPCGTDYRPDGKFTVCSATGYLTNKDHRTHIHCGW